MVYEAYDRKENALVALKVLRSPEADALYRFKKGFRSLADIRHPNLVSFYQLMAHGDLWFFSMELIDGQELVDALGLREKASGAADFDRIRHITLQLSRGLQAVHEHGKVHRDIKPPNVLVTADDRVKLLDFGLVTELGRRRAHPAAEVQMVGTPAYMSPEQASGDSGSPAGDWYSVGVMLYQMLSGELPFDGSLLEILTGKQRGLAENELRRRVPDVPRDLERLCFDLLTPDPGRRIVGDEVISVLEGKETGIHVIPGAKAKPDPSSESTPFVGRESILGHLHVALSESRRRTVMTHVSAPSGMGKSALVEQFVRQIDRQSPDSVVLAGRCYVQESVPYKALDSLIDALSRHLMALGRHDVEVLLPTQVTALARLFPVLARVPAVAEAPDTAGAESRADAAEPRVLRRRAFNALREMLARMAERHPLVLVLDDLQWGDLDSFDLLDDLLRWPDPLSLLIIACYRSEDLQTSPFLQKLLAGRLEDRWAEVEMRDLELTDLSAEEARELWQKLGERDVPADELRSMLSDAAGSPLLLSELARSGGVGAAGSERLPGIDELIRSRVERLHPSARRLLEVVAVAGQPVDAVIARQAAGTDVEGVSAVAELRTERLVRMVEVEGREQIVTYHDRIREAVTDPMDEEELREIHGRLARALESSGWAEPETLVVHFRATEEDERAHRYALSAAERAEEALAFERAARLYRLALDLLPPEARIRSDLQVRLGRALGNAGHSRHAADTFLKAVESGIIDPLEAQRSAAEKLLISGHIDRGLAVLRHVLRTVDMELDPSVWRSLLDLWISRLRLRLRGFDLVERDASEIDPKRLLEIDVCWSVEVGLCLVDVLHASQFHARHLLLALEVGEPQRVARGLAMEVFFGAMEGIGGRDVLERARDLAGRVEGSYAASLTEMAAGMRACSKGEWSDAQRRLARAETQLRENRRGVTWELDTVHQFRAVALVHLGRWRELFIELPDLLDQARQQDDLYLETHLHNWVETLRELARGKPESAARVVERGLEAWSRQGFHFQHFGHLQAQVQVALHRGHGEEAWSLVENRWPALANSMIQRIEMVLVQSHDLRGRAAVAAAVEARERSDDGAVRSRLRAAEKDARLLEKAGSAWARALAAALRAGIASVENAEARAIEQLALAETGFEGADMVVHTSLVRRRRGQIGRDAAQIAKVDAALEARGISSPESISSIFLPGAWSFE